MKIQRIVFFAIILVQLFFVLDQSQYIVSQKEAMKRLKAGHYDGEGVYVPLNDMAWLSLRIASRDIPETPIELIYYASMDRCKDEIARLKNDLRAKGYPRKKKNHEHDHKH